MIDKRSLLAVFACCALLACGGGGKPQPLPEPTQDPRPDPQTPLINGQEPAPNAQDPVLPADLGGESGAGSDGEGGAPANDR